MALTMTPRLFLLCGSALILALVGFAFWCGLAGRDVWLFQGVALLVALCIFGMGWAVTRVYRRRAEQLLELHEEATRIFVLSADVLAMVDSKGELRNLNPAWTQITGRPVELGGVNLLDVVHSQDASAMRAALASASAVPQQIETRLSRADGTYAWVTWRMVKLETGLNFVIGRDVTEDKLREAQLRQSQKMETIGRLTGGIAHDFNNLLTVIMGSLELLQRDLAGADAKTTRRINTAMAGGHRAAALTQRLLAFARRQPLEAEPIDPNELVADMSEMLRRVLGEDVALVMNCAPGVWRVMTDGHQLESAILNLAVNARDAMPGGGRLTIETKNVTLPEGHVQDREMAPGQYVLITVTDTGAGMAPEVQERAFEPFFTTKPPGQGTGLGLAQVHSFIRQSHGHTKLCSQPGVGTVVKLYLPRLHAEMEEALERRLEAALPLSPEECQGRGETVLLVEDEEVVRLFAEEVLREYGYNVITAEDAAAALPIIDSAQPVDLLFTDLVLSGEVSGAELAALFAKRRPDVPILFTTGYTRGGIASQGRQDERAEFIGKPFTAAGLAQTLRRILDGRGKSDLR
jgi:PAS domain S-box-containing protein